MRVLFHVCCGPCFARAGSTLREAGHDVTAFWYNPNIHPYLEHQHRLEAMKSLAEEMKTPLIITNGYDIIDYFRQVVGDEAQRCRHCFSAP